MYRNGWLERFFLMACFTKRVVTSMDVAEPWSIDLVLFYLWVCKFQCFYFRYFFYFLFSTKDGAMYLSFLSLTRSYFAIVRSQTARHESKWESDRGTLMQTASVRNTTYFTVSFLSTTVKDNNRQFGWSVDEVTSHLESQYYSANLQVWAPWTDFM